MNKLLKSTSLFCLFALLVLAGCASEAPTVPLQTLPALRSEAETPKDLLAVHSVLIAPITFSKNTLTHKPGAKLDTDKLAQILEDDARRELGFDVITNSKIPKTSAPMSSNDLALKLGVDAILNTTVNEFVAREGSLIGGPQPARVDLELVLARARDGRKLWSASYHLADQAVSDNLLELGKAEKREHGATFRTAEEIYSDGLRRAFRDLDGERTAAFTGGKPLGE